jgi:transcriptional regulator with XRE-family HTH domain
MPAAAVRELPLDRLPDLRRARALTLRELSARCGFQPAYLFYLEHGLRATKHEAQRLAAALGCRISELHTGRN